MDGVYAVNTTSKTFVADVTKRTSTVTIKNSDFAHNSITVVIWAAHTDISDSLFHDNIGQLVNTDKCSIQKSTFQNEHFDILSYIHVNNSITIDDCIFNNMGDASDFGTSIIDIQTDLFPLDYSLLSNLHITNCNSSVIVVSIKNANVNFTDSQYDTSNGLFVSVIHNLPGRAKINLENLTSTNCEGALFDINIFHNITGPSSIYDNDSLEIQMNDININYQGGSNEFPIIINNIAGTVTLNNISMIGCPLGISSFGNIVVNSFSSRNATSINLVPYDFSYGLIEISGFILENIASVSSLMESSESTALISDFTINNCTSEAGSILDLYNGETVFSNGLISNSKGLGMCSLALGTLEFVDSVFENNKAQFGGAINQLSGITILNNCNFTGNKAEYGGAIYLADGDFQWSNSSCIDNFSFQDGGCMFTQNLITGNIDNVIFSQNQCLGSGGAISFRNLNSITFNNCIVSNNAALNGGGIYFSGSSNSGFYNGTITNNTAISSGGGLMIKEQAKPIIKNTIISYNYAASTGGGLRVADSSQPLLKYLNITYNSSPNEGGGISFTDTSIADISETYISYNYVNSSGGGIVFSISTHGYVNNVIIDGNSAKSRGGGIAFYNHCYPTLQNVTIKNNIAPEGAGISSKDVSNFKFIESTLELNEATSGGGAGLLVDHSLGSFYNCTFNNNVGSGVAGAIALNDFASTTFELCFFNNNNGNRGGSLFSSSQTPITFENCFFQNNGAVYGGAILLTDQSNTKFINSTCIDNVATKQGGCINIEEDAELFISNMFIARNSATGSLVGSGGGINLSDRSIVNIIESQFLNNTSPQGGGLYVDQFSTLNATSIIVKNNHANEGGGIFSSGLLLTITDSSFKTNYASLGSGRGGGLAIITNSFETTNSSLCYRCTFDENEAYKGGGLFVSINDKTKDIDLNFDNNNNNFVNSFSELSFSLNSANRGGGIYTELPNEKIQYSGITFESNIAEDYGGGLFIFRNHALNETIQWMSDASFVVNNALNGGPNVGWSVTDKNSDFCDKCIFGEAASSFDGYGNNDGWASPPDNLNFVNACPSDVYLSNDPFDVSLVLVDKFNTAVIGHLPEHYPLNITLEVIGNCSVSTHESLTQKVDSLGKIYFDSIELSGYNNHTCSLIFYMEKNTYSSYFVTNATCDVVFNGCPKNELISSVTGLYDTCIENVSQEKKIDQVLFLMLIILFLLLFIIILVCGTLIWDKFIREKPKPFVFPISEMHDITLENLLSDPDIPNIPWNDIEPGERIGIGATGIVLSGCWQKDTTTLLDVALKEILIGNQNFIDGTILANMLVEIKLMWYVI